MDPNAVAFVNDRGAPVAAERSGVVLIVTPDFRGITVLWAPDP